MNVAEAAVSYLLLHHEITVGDDFTVVFIKSSGLRRIDRFPGLLTVDHLNNSLQDVLVVRIAVDIVVVEAGRKLYAAVLRANSTYFTT